MLRTAQRTFHTPPVFVRNTGIPGELDRLRRDLDRQIDEVTGRLQDIGQIRSRQSRYRALDLLGEDNAHAYTALRDRGAQLTGQGGHDEADMAAVRERVATLRWLGITTVGAVNLMRVYEDQLPFEEAVMQPAHAQPLMDEHARLCANLAASSDPAQRDRAALAIALVPAEHRASFMALATAGSPLRRQVEGWLERHDGRTPTLQQLLLMRHVAHAYSGVFPAFGGLEALGGLCPTLARVLRDTYADQVRFREATVTTLHGLEGLRRTREGATYLKGMSSLHNPALRLRLRPYHALDFSCSTSATVHASQGYIGARGAHPAGDVMLRLHCGGLGGGPVRTVLCDIFNLEETYTQGEVLLVGSHSFRVMPGNVETHRDPEGGCTEVHHFDLHKMRDATRDEGDIA